MKRIIENDVYLTRPYEEVAGLVSPEVAAKLDPDQGYGLYWFGRIRMRRNYGPRQKSTKFTVEHNDRKEWIAIPVPDSGIPPEWVQTARERVANNVRWAPNTSPEVRLRGRIRCACGYSMTNIKSDERRYYVCSQHRKRGRCKHVRFHHLKETEERVERFVLGLIEDRETLRQKVEELLASILLLIRGPEPRRAPLLWASRHVSAILPESIIRFLCTQDHEAPLSRSTSICT